MGTVLLTFQAYRVPRYDTRRHSDTTVGGEVILVGTTSVTLGLEIAAPTWYRTFATIRLALDTLHIIP
jgi:hypothetical protein